MCLSKMKESTNLEGRLHYMGREKPVQLNGFICTSQQTGFLQNLLKGVWHHGAFHQGPQPGLCFRLLQKNRANILLPPSRMFSEGGTRYPLYLKGEEGSHNASRKCGVPSFHKFYYCYFFKPGSFSTSPLELWSSPGFLCFASTDIQTPGSPTQSLCAGHLDRESGW